MEFSFLGIPSPSRALLLSTIFSLTSALPWSGPDPTASYRPADWNPRPTSVPPSLPEIRKRDNQNASICGWVNGNVYQPAACQSDEKCVYDTLHGMVGCCPLSGSCTVGVYTACVNAEQTALNPSVLTCTGESVCYQNTYPGGYSQYGCGASSDIQHVATTYSGQDWNFQLNAIYTQVTLATSLLPNPTTSQSTALPTSLSTPSSSSSQSSSAKSSSEHQTTSSASESRSTTASGPTTASTGISTSTPTSTSPGTLVGVQSGATITAVGDGSTGQSSQARAGIIAGSVVGGVGVIFAILALGCSVVRGRRKKRAEERARSIPTKEKSLSVSSYASSQSSVRAGFRPFSPDDVVSPLTPFLQPPTAPSQSVVQEVSPEVSQHEVPQHAQQGEMQRLVEPEEPYVRRVQLFDGPSIDELADLPLPWVRPPTPPPRSPKRLTLRSQQPENHTPLEAYLSSEAVPVGPSASVRSHASDTSHYSRTTEGRSIYEDRKSIRRRDEELPLPPPPMPPVPPVPPIPPVPPMSIARKPVGSGWYRPVAPVVERKSSGDHVAFHLADNSSTGAGRSLTAPQQGRERSSSAPEATSVTNDMVGLYSDLGVDINQARISDDMETGTESVAPLRLSVIKKRGNSLVPILGVPAAPPPGERGPRLYDVMGGNVI